mmetsp:Transcript_2197/g.5434  ORF Transcript_2197/g.5434 Transcript_2197/m.5434 type:complete len:181 (-) Transcript_2197:225-767(-)|eukprot:CAMPEP_0117568774 /NCGR_PEP_ID=MMETSP0784-20121206/58315_1 /TAXON_ID=39447 /ORGANISM="" /LENGTH=180 /DNA_ID=CAMNT_0005366725 /DNA_START=38 /DNA_END=580 /DNA_ORIENTATION=-
MQARGFSDWFAVELSRELQLVTANVSKRIVRKQLCTVLLCMRRTLGQKAVLPADVRYRLAAFLGVDQLPRHSGVRLRLIAEAALVVAKEELRKTLSELLDAKIMPSATRAAEACKFSHLMSWAYSDTTVQKLTQLTDKLRKDTCSVVVEALKDADFKNASARYITSQYGTRTHFEVFVSW